MVLFPEHTHAAVVANSLDIRAALGGINGTFLQLLVDMAQLHTDPPVNFVEELRETLLRLNSHVNLVAARAPFLLVDIEFRNAAWWEAIAAEASRSVALPAGELNPARARALELARSTLMLAWHMARTDRESSLIEIGMSVLERRLTPRGVRSG